MKLTFLEPLYAQPGPCACVYLDTSRDIDAPDRAIELRWRHLHEELTAQGADTATLEVLAEEVGTDQEVSGRHGQAVFARDGLLVLEEELPVPPVRDTARFTSLPDALPLALQHAPDFPYAAVVVNRIGPADTGGGQEEVEVAFQAGRWPVSRVAPSPRYHRYEATEDWPRSAVRIADELENLADRCDAEVIVICGDAWARGVLTHRMPRPLRDRVVTVAGDGHAVVPGRALLEDELSELFQGRMSAHDEALIETFLAQRARHKDAVEGLASVVTALQRGQAAALLIDTPAEFPVPIWAGSESSQIALSAADLRSFGEPSVQEESAGAALIRAVVGTGAELIVVPRQVLPLKDGVGVVMRYFDPGT